MKKINFKQLFDIVKNYVVKNKMQVLDGFALVVPTSGLLIHLLSGNDTILYIACTTVMFCYTYLRKTNEVI